MRKNLAAKLFFEFAQAHPEYRVRNNLLLRVPVAEVLCGVLLEGSAFDKNSFQPIAFVQPLYEKSESITLSIAARFPGNWNSEEPRIGSRLALEIKEKALPFFNTFGSAAGLAVRQPDDRNSLAFLTKAYSLAQIHEFNGAQTEIEKGIQSITRIYKPDLEKKDFWAHQVIADAKHFQHQLKSDPKQAQGTLRAWRSFTLKHLELEEYSAGDI